MGTDLHGRGGENRKGRKGPERVGRNFLDLDVLVLFFSVEATHFSPFQYEQI